MFTKKNRFLSGFMVLCTTVLLLSACGQGGTKGEGTRSALGTGVPKDNVEIEFYMAGTRQEPDTGLVMEKVNEYLKDKINAKINYHVIDWGSYDHKMNTMLASGEPMDIIFTTNWTANFRLNATTGYFLALDDYLKQSSTIEKIVGKDFLDGSSINGKHYGLPSNGTKAHSWGYALKKDLVEKYDIDLSSIKTTRDLVPYFEEIKADEPGVYPLLLLNMDTPYHLLDWDALSDDDIPGALYPDGRNTKVVNQFLAPETIDYYNEMREYFLKGYVPQDAATMASDNQMKSGKYFASVTPIVPGKEATLYNTTGIQWATVQITKPAVSSRETTGSLLAIPTSSKNPERAFRFIEMLYTDKYLRNLFSFGIENVHYTINPDGRVKLTKEGNDKYNPGGSGWKYGDQFKDLLYETEDPQKFKLYDEFNKSATVMPSLGFIFDKTDEVENKMLSCKTVVQNYYKQLFSGSVDVDSTVAKFERDLKAAGVDDVINEMQKQYDEWLGKKGK